MPFFHLVKGAVPEKVLFTLYAGAMDLSNAVCCFASRYFSELVRYMTTKAAKWEQLLMKSMFQCIGDFVFSEIAKQDAHNVL